MTINPFDAAFPGGLTPIAAVKRFLDAASTGDEEALWYALGTPSGELLDPSRPSDRLLVIMLAHSLCSPHFKLPEIAEIPDNNVAHVCAEVYPPGLNQPYAPLELVCALNTDSGRWLVSNLADLEEIVRTSLDSHRQRAINS